MGLMDVLGRYAEQQLNVPPPQVAQDFGRVAQEAPADTLSAGLEHAFRSDATPPFEQMVRNLFEHSNEQQRAGLLNEILAAVPGSMAGGVLGNILGRGGQVTPQQARDVNPADVEAAAAQAAQGNPGIIQAVSRFYAQHPGLVQNLGSAALAVAMARMARRH